MLYHKIQSVWKRDCKTGAFLDEFTCPEFEYLAPALWTCSEKIDGTNMRVIFDPPGTLHVKAGVKFGGRTERAQIPTGLLERMQQLFPFEKLASKFTGSTILYGEGIGPKIQDSRLSPGGYDFVLFDVRVGDWWLRRDAVFDVAQVLGIQYAPELGSRTLYEAVEMVREGFTSRLPSAAPDTPAEGLILRPLVDLCTRRGGRIITKLKTKDFK